jgi:flagellar biogenesis protein FliO
MEWTNELGAIGGTLLLLIGLLAFSQRGRHLHKWLSGRRAERGLEVVDRLALGPQHTIHLVRWGNRGLLLAVFSNGCSLLQSVPWSEVESPLGSNGGRSDRELAQQ